MPTSALFRERTTMGLGGLQHFTIEPSDLERTKDFYCDVLGLENGDRPPLDFPGYWLYSGGVATVLLMVSGGSSISRSHRAAIASLAAVSAQRHCCCR